jgi:hypothetical protein
MDISIYQQTKPGAPARVDAASTLADFIKSGKRAVLLSPDCGDFDPMILFLSFVDSMPAIAAERSLYEGFRE